ncbi:hypothetical protein BJ878DRAFT_515102 [Calycina marina]|uniref:Putative lipoate-protein ligase A n=1 Tax=Calycina marina TaxID=1763456 RepID=A0A9P7Z0A7_9HELO|nr:hypothetical protein BJ878DRAFT_515102 [Calycina marina]
MAPSRGLYALLRRSQSRPNWAVQSFRRFSELARIATDTSRRSLVFISRLTDPYINLSIEHYLLQKTPPESKVLFLYVNRPCVVLGRNQNPWVEANLPFLSANRVDLVRRRSGGGTVFHDLGNVNYSVICPISMFDRDTHAQMVVRALQKVGGKHTRVNERHDIVQDMNEPGLNKEDRFEGDLRPFKVSGSAYKLTRLRSLHHGTCLLHSENLPRIDQYLKSLVKKYITARGVDSVRSNVANVIPKLDNDAFIKAVIDQWHDLYGQEGGELQIHEADNYADVPEVMKGCAELMSPEWIYGQTPQFTYGRRTEKGKNLEFTARNGVITEATLRSQSNLDSNQALSDRLTGSVLYDTMLQAKTPFAEILYDRKPDDVLDSLRLSL